MSNNIKWKLIGVIASAVVALYLLIPTLLNFNQKKEEAIARGEPIPGTMNFFPDSGVNLGLDLRGGLYVELDVDLKEAVKNRVDVLLAEIERLANASGNFEGLKLEQVRDQGYVQVNLLPEKRNSFLDFLRENFGDIFELASSPSVAEDSNASETPPSAEPNVFWIRLIESYVTHLQEMTLKQAVEAVRNRIDRYGVAEASIQLQGADRIIVEIPGVKNPDRVINVIRKTGLLEFKLVDDSVPEAELNSWIAEAREKNKIPSGYSKEVVDQINEALKGKIPEDDEVLFEVQRDPVTKEILSGIPYLVKKRAEVTGDMLRNAQVGIADNEPHVSLSFNKIGTKNFGELTKANVGKKLAIVLDGLVSKAPVIQTAILNGEAQITLGYGNYQSLLSEAEDLALLLREGALPASLTIATKTLIGPSLGADSIRKGIRSMLVAALVVILFMGIYYKWGGVLADIALLLNVLFIFAIMALFQASLSLPGIAGIILTMGMAVDANVIIFERMREEARLGKTPQAIVQSGYSNAMSAIIDSNLTTLISGIVLYQFGTGPIKGFATTLMIGILTTMFTAIVVTRIVYDYFVFKKKIKKLSI